MLAKNPFKGHRFAPEIILLAVRWYCRYPLSYRDVRDLLAERGISVDAATINHWVVKFGPEIAKRSFSRRGPRGLDCYVDETYVRVGGKWRYSLPGSALRSNVPRGFGGQLIRMEKSLIFGLQRGEMRKPHAHFLDKLRKRCGSMGQCPSQRTRHRPTNAFLQK